MLGKVPAARHSVGRSTRETRNRRWARRILLGWSALLQAVPLSQHRRSRCHFDDSLLHVQVAIKRVANIGDF